MIISYFQADGKNALGTLILPNDTGFITVIREVRNNAPRRAIKAEVRLFGKKIFPTIDLTKGTQGD